jgi:hypothetical protein
MRSPRVPWWPGSVVSGSGVHLHHLVWGICLMMGAGTLGFLWDGASPWFELAAVAFGIGAGLTIDEFALWVHLKDVYWTDQGRSSIDATLLAATAMLVVLLGARPFDLAAGTPIDAIGSAVGSVWLLALVTMCFAKDRLMHGTIGLILWPLSLYGAVRLGKPRSPWARRFYGPGKQARAEERFAPERRTEQLKERLRDAIGGSTEAAYEVKLAQRAPAPPDDGAGTPS